MTNVEAQLRNTTSLLHWTRRIIEVRKQNPALAGSFDDLGGSNPSVLTYVRTFGDDVVMCKSTTSVAQPVELDLRRYEDWRPVELLGGVEFPMIGELPYFLTLTGHGFYWFRLISPQSGMG